MKLYIITSNPFPNGMAATNRIASYAKGATEKGMECEVISYHRTESPNKVNNLYTKGEFLNFKYRYIGNNTIRHKNIFIRKFNDIKDLFFLYIFILTKIHKRDVILTFAG